MRFSGGKYSYLERSVDQAKSRKESQHVDD